MSRSRRRLAAGAIAVACAVGLSGVVGAQADTGTTEQYVVVYKAGQNAAGQRAVEAAGGTVLSASKIGVATVESSNADFAAQAGASNAVEAVGPNIGVKLDRSAEGEAADAEPSPIVAAGCAQQYDPPGGTGAGPDPLSVCQWDMRISNASPTGSYAVNRGEGAAVGIMDTGVDLQHPDIAPNLDLARSCSFVRPGTPTSIPQDWESTDDCSTKSAVQDYFGHGTHVAGEVGAPINGMGVAGVAPEVTLVGLKASTSAGYFFTQQVVDALVHAGDVRLDVVNMSFFADPWWMNCHNDAGQQAIVKAISRAAQYAHNRDVVLVGSAGNDATDLDHPTTDAISPDYPPGSEQEREVGNNCVVLPAELPWTVTVSAIGPAKRLSFYSNYSNSKVDVTAAGGASDQAPNPYGRVLNAWSSTAPPVGLPGRDVEDCQGPGGTPPCAAYAWVQGTSMASPHAAGVAALIRSAHPDMPPKAVEARLQDTAMPMDCPEGDDRCTGGGQTNFYGTGLVDALAAGTR